jgi:uncharacterized protein
LGTFGEEAELARGKIFCSAERDVLSNSSRILSEGAHTTVASLTPCPIEPSWIIEGNPSAEASLLSKSADGQAWTVVWQCSEGKFNWIYGYDETILILEGSIVIEGHGMPPTRYGPGDVVFFKRGTHAKWHVEGHVRKLAFCRHPQPILLSYALRAASKIKRTLITKRKTEVLAATLPHGANAP